MADETRNIPRRQRPQGSPHRGRRLIALALTTAVAFTVVGIGNAQALITTTQPQLSLNHFIRTTPFVGSTTEVQDNEGSAYVAGDDSLWMASDNDDALFEVNRTTGALRRKVAQAAFVNAPRFGVGGAAGQARTEDLEALAYDANADVIYAFSGSTSATPTAFRLARDANGQFQVQSWQPLPIGVDGCGVARGRRPHLRGQRLDHPHLQLRHEHFGPSFSISGLTKIYGLDFDDVTGDLLAVNNKQRLYRASMTTRTLLPGWNGILLTGFGLLDTRGVEVVGEQVLVTDGADSSVRPHTDPMSHAVFVLDVSGPGRAGADGELHRDADHRPGAAHRQLRRYEHRWTDELGLDLRRRRHLDGAVALAHLHQQRDLHRNVDRHQRARVHVEPRGPSPSPSRRRRRRASPRRRPPARCRSPSTSPTRAQEGRRAGPGTSATAAPRRRSRPRTPTPAPGPSRRASPPPTRRGPPRPPATSPSTRRRPSSPCRSRLTPTSTPGARPRTTPPLRP